MRLPLCLAALPFLLAACAHQPARPVPSAELGDKLDKASSDLMAMEREASLVCLPSALHLLYLIQPSDPKAHELAFANYYTSMLDACEQDEYVACLKRRWRMPLLHAEYRRGRHWLSATRQRLRETERWITPAERLSRVTENFTDKDASTTVHRIHLAFADGRTQTIEETFAKSAQDKKEEADLKALDQQVKDIGRQIEAIDQPINETPEQRRKRLGL